MRRSIDLDASSCTAMPKGTTLVLLLNRNDLTNRFDPHISQWRDIITKRAQLGCPRARGRNNRVVDQTLMAIFLSDSITHLHESHGPREPRQGRRTPPTRACKDGWNSLTLVSTSSSIGKVKETDTQTFCSTFPFPPRNLTSMVIQRSPIPTTSTCVL